MIQPEILQLATIAASSPVAVALINKIADVIGWGTAPMQQIRMAKAQAEANFINALSDLAGQDLIGRAATRSMLEDIREQQIIERIVAKTLDTLDDQATPANIENDWLANLLTKCRHTSDEQMQNTWARILAGEANNPGSFSRKTVNIVADLEQSDACNFVQLAGFTWMLNQTPTPLIYDLIHPTYAGCQIDHNVCLRLDELGLINFRFPDFNYIQLQTDLKASYDSQAFTIQATDPRPALNIGSALYTQAGEQLYNISDPILIDGFFEYAKERLLPPDANIV